MIGRWIIGSRINPKPKTTRLWMVATLLIPLWLLLSPAIAYTKLNVILTGLRLKASHAQLINYVQQVQSGKITTQHDTPPRVGLFWIQSTQLDQQTGAVLL